MASKAGIFICLLIVILDVTAGILGFEAEIAQDKVKHLKVLLIDCQKPSHQAYVMALAAVILMFVAHFMINFLACCESITSQLFNPCSWISKVFLVLAWIAMVVVMVMMWWGSIPNEGSKETCGLSRNGYLKKGGTACFFHGAFSLAYYVTSTLLAPPCC